MPPPTEAACLILAAGLSSRMGSPKTLLPWGEKTTVLEHIIQTVQAAQVGKVWVVTGHKFQTIEPLVINLNAQPAFNSDYAKGEILSSLKAGLQALPETIGIALVLLGDQPLIRSETIKQVYDAWQDGYPLAVVPTFQGQRGHPVLFSRALWPALLSLPSDAMPREVLKANAQHIQTLPVEDEGILLDLDTPQDYLRLRK